MILKLKEKVRDLRMRSNFLAYRYLDVELSKYVCAVLVDHMIMVYSHPGSFRLFVHVWVIMMTTSPEAPEAPTYIST